MKDKFAAPQKTKCLVIIGTIAHMGGAERQALYLVEHLSRTPNMLVELLTFEDGQALRPALDALGVKIHVHPYYFRWPRAVRFRSLLKLGFKLRNQIRPDALLPFVGVHSKTAAQVWKLSGACFCWWNQQDEGRDLHGTPEESKILRKVSCITSNSFAGRDFLVETFGLSPDSVLVYNNGTPIPTIAPQKGIYRERLKIGSRPLVSMVANLTSFKDHKTLLDAWAMVLGSQKLRERPVLALAGHHREQETVTSLKLQVYELGLSKDDVRFLGPISDVPELLADTDLLVHSSIKEGCPNAVCEAMALGLPVVATDIPGCRQALGKDGEVWLARPHDSAELAIRILQMLQSDTMRMQVGTSNRARIESDFSIPGMNRFFERRIEAGLGVPIDITAAAAN